MNKKSIIIIVTITGLIISILVAYFVWTNSNDGFVADKSKSDTTPIDDNSYQEGKVLSAFFGLDNELPSASNFLVCNGSVGMDGMPVIFDKEIEIESVQAGDFQVTTGSGNKVIPFCVTFKPAIDPGELRTALIVGEFGSADLDPPETLKIIGNIISKDSQSNYLNAKIAVTPLSSGPTLILAEIIPKDQWKTEVTDFAWSNGNGCDTQTKQVVRAVWSGGIKLPDGNEAGDEERKAYKIALKQIDGGPETVIPVNLADLGDGDNNHLLCLDNESEIQSVSFAAGKLVDPNNDINPETMVNL